MTVPFFRGSRRRSLPPDIAIIESLVIPAFVLDADRKIVVWNSALEELTGVKASDVVQTQNHWRGFYDHERPCLADLLYQDGSNQASSLYVAQTGGDTNQRSRRAENWCTMPVRGAKRYLMIDASAIVDEKGRLLAVVETLRDTTAEQDAKVALLAQKEQQEKAVADQLATACRELGAAMSALSKGDLTYRIDTALPGAIDRLRVSFNEALDTLEAVVRRTTSTASTVYEGSGKIAHAAEDLSRWTEQQAANLEETAAALSQIMGTVQKTAAGAAHARSVVASAREDVARSEQIVHGAVEAMGNVAQSSRQISLIVGVMDEIAFQTNLLALNAGVEAARAGEVGRGFAVVAAEVRALAQRSAESTKDIKGLMSSSATHVERGVALVGQAGTALNRIVTQIAHIDGVVADFAQSSQDQATGLNEINTAVAQMDQVTQQNAAMVQEATTISQDLLQETASLETSLQRFQVHSDSAPQTERPGKQLISVKVPNVPVRPKVVRSKGAAMRKPQPATDDWDEF